MTSPTWRDLAAGAQAAVPQPPSTGTPAPTPNWRDLTAQPPAPAAPAPAAPAPAPPVAEQSPTWPPGAPAPAAPAAPAPPPGFPAPAAPVVGDAGWQVPAAAQASPLTPQATAPSSAPPGDPAEASAEVGMRIAAAGATPTDVDTRALLAQLQALQARVDTLTQANVAAAAPPLVRYATAFADHLQAKADAHPTINADPDNTFIPALRSAAQLVNGAEYVAASGAGHEQLVNLAKDAGAWVKAHARRFPQIDYDYILQLAEEVGSAAVKLATAA